MQACVERRKPKLPRFDRRSGRTINARPADCGCPHRASFGGAELIFSTTHHETDSKAHANTKTHANPEANCDALANANATGKSLPLMHEQGTVVHELLRQQQSYVVHHILRR